MKIAILIEGRTETAFKSHLREFLDSRLPGDKPKLDMVRYDGLIPRGEKLRKEVQLLLSGRDPASAVVALTDVYTGMNDFADASDAKKKMRDWVGDNTAFYPHAAQYEFEAWLLPYWEEIQNLAKHNRNAPGGSPENVNNTKPPSFHIKEIFEAGKGRDSYSKPRDANRILRGKDLRIAADACPELKAFLNTLLRLSGGRLL